MQIKTTMRHHLTPVRMAVTKKSKNRCWQGCGEKGILVHYWECKLVQPLWKAVWGFLKELKTIATWPSNPIVEYNPEEYKWFYQRDLCMHAFIAVPFTITKTWNQTKYPSVVDWKKKMWYMYTMEYYAAIKKNKITYPLQQHGWSSRQLS